MLNLGPNLRSDIRGLFDPLAILCITMNGIMRVESDSSPPQVKYDYETDRWKIRLQGETCMIYPSM